jgi:two-component system sensor histidine kinase KdpD
VLGQTRPPRFWGLIFALIGVALATVAIYPLKQFAPVVSLSVVYLPVVLSVAALWGWSLGIVSSVLSAAAFNFFHIPPVGRFTIADSRNWIALVAFMVVSLSASAIAELARARAREAERGRSEADLAADLARELLGGTDTATALAGTARRLAAALGLPSVAIELGPGPPADGRRQTLMLRDAEAAVIGRLTVPAGLAPQLDQRLHARVLPTLSALLAVALRRDAIQAEAVQTEALRRSDDVKTALLRAVSHDLRTPLTAIVAAGHALGSPSLTDTDRGELADAVREQGQRMAALVEKLLDLSRLQAGRAGSRRDWVSVPEVIESARDGLDSEAAARVRVFLAPDLPEIRGDAAQLERAIANLLENAVHVSATVAVTARAGTDAVIITVVDRGPGIAAAERERIFEPFYRAESGQSGRGTGSGLGLAIARGFIEANGGTLRLDSHPGQGASFQISLPLPAPAPGSPADTAVGESVSAAAPAGGHRR